MVMVQTGVSYKFKRIADNFCSLAKFAEGAEGFSDFSGKNLKDHALDGVLIFTDIIYLIL